jgi:signal transduction histidine kinase
MAWWGPRGGPRRRATLGFAARLSLATSLLVGVACAVQTWLVSHYAIEQARTQLAASGQRQAALVADQARGAMEIGDVEALRQVAERMVMRGEVDSCRLFDASGLLLATSGAAAGGPLAGAAGGPIVVGGDRWAFVTSIGDATAGSSIGTVEITIPTASLAALRRRIVTSAGAFALLVIACAIVAAELMARRITGPVTALARAADAIAAGELETSVTVRRHDEIGTLAASFNAMGRSLAQSRAAVLAKMQELEEANHLKSEFVATVSHELRTPLNVMLGCIEMLRDEAEGALTAGQRGLLDSIDRYARTQLALVTDVLDFSRLGSGGVTCRVERIEVRALLAELVAAHEPGLRERGVALVTDVAPDVPPLETDRTKLDEILGNLIGNALKFTPTGTISVAVARAADADDVVFEVRDTGVGIDPEDLPRVFEPFYQAGSSSTRATSGVGLGLAIVRRLTALLGGGVTIESTPGNGTVARVRIPCQLAGEPADPLAAALDGVARNAKVVAMPDHPLRARKADRRAE